MKRQPHPIDLFFSISSLDVKLSENCVLRFISFYFIRGYHSLQKSFVIGFTLNFMIIYFCYHIVKKNSLEKKTND